MMKINLPEHVLDFTSTNVPEPKLSWVFCRRTRVLRERLYTAPDGFGFSANDYSDGHRPHQHPQAGLSVCPARAGNQTTRSVVNIPVAGAQSYQLPVAKWVSAILPDAPTDRSSGERAVCFWFVADGEQTPDNHQRMLWLARDLLRTGVLQRWAYISYFSVCPPGQEDATFERMKNLIAHPCRNINCPRPPLTAKLNLRADYYETVQILKTMLRRDRQIRTQIHQLADACLFAASFWLAYVLRADPEIVAGWIWPPSRPTFSTKSPGFTLR